MKNTVKKLAKSLIPAKARPRLKTIYKKARHFGFGHQCVFCRARLQTFLPYALDFPVLKEKKVVGGGWRMNCLCPVCDSFDRERLLYLYLLHKTDVFSKPQKLLHVAPEVRVRKILAAQPGLDYVTADLLAPDVDMKMDLTDIRIPDHSFDAVICNHVLEHIIDDRKAMAELYRVLKPGGWAILQVPISLTLEETYEDFSITAPRDREQAFGQDDHVRIYAEDYSDRLVEAGFTIDIFDWRTEAANFGGRKNIFSLNEDECVYLAKKP
jgi:SAM-dependent methyltransferase